MKGKAAVAAALSLLFISGGAALSMDTFIDQTACTMGLATPFAGAACTIATYDDIMSGSPEDVQNDIYIKSAFVVDARERVNTEQRSHLNQTYGIAMSDAKIQIIKGLNSGMTQAEAAKQGVNSVKDLYSSYEMRVIAQRNREALKLNETKRKIEDTSGLSLGDVFKVRRAVNDPITRIEFHWRGVQDIRVVEKNYTLFNGTTTTVMEAQAKFKRVDNYNNEGDDVVEYVNFSTQASYETYGRDSNCDNDCGQYSNKETRDTVIRVVNVNGNASKFVHGTPYVNTLDSINSRYQTAYTTVTELADGIYSNYQRGEVNVSDVCAALCSVRQAATNYQDTGAYSYLAYTQYQMGLASDENAAFDITIHDRNLTDTGQLFLETEAWENTTIEVNETYDASNKPAYFVYKPDGAEAQKVSINGNFTVNELWNTKNNTQINSTTVQQTDFHTKSTADLEQQLEEVERVQDVTLDVSGASEIIGAGESFIDSLIPDLSTIQLVLGAAALGAFLVILVMAGFKIAV